MRRCGRVSCIVLVGFLAAVMAARGAYAAAGGHQGKGHAWAKGQSKHAAAAPQLSPPAPAGKRAAPARKAHVAAKARPKAPSHRLKTRPNHLTICHRTGSGRYIVISPSVRGALTGHLRHHDDFVYNGSCARQPTPTPSPVPAPGSHGDPQARPKLPEAGGPPAVTARALPFTGFPAVPVLLAGLALVGTGFALRRKAAATT
jgi:hypothetical protein